VPGKVIEQIWLRVLRDIAKREARLNRGGEDETKPKSD